MHSKYDAFIHSCIHTCKPTRKQIDRQTVRWTDTQTHRHTDTQTRHTGMLPYMRTFILTECTHTRTHTHVNIHTSSLTRTHIYTRARTHRHIKTLTPTHTHTPTRPRPPKQWPFLYLAAQQRPASTWRRESRCYMMCLSRVHARSLSMHGENYDRATHCSTMQYTAAYCSILQHTAAHCNALSLRGENHETATHSRHCIKLQQAVSY